MSEPSPAHLMYEFFADKDESDTVAEAEKSVASMLQERGLTETDRRVCVAYDIVEDRSVIHVDIFAGCKAPPAPEGTISVLTPEKIKEYSAKWPGVRAYRDATNPSKLPTLGE
jgi:hypothetical protein